MQMIVIAEEKFTFKTGADFFYYLIDNWYSYFFVFFYFPFLIQLAYYRIKLMD